MAKRKNPFDSAIYGVSTPAKVADDSGVNPFDRAIYTHPLPAPQVRTYQITGHTPPKPTPTYSAPTQPVSMPVQQEPETQSGFIPAVIKGWGEFKYNLLSVLESLTTPMEIKIRDDASKTEKIAAELSGTIYDREKQLSTDGVQLKDIAVAGALAAIPGGLLLAGRYTDVGKEVTKGLLGVKDRIVAAKREIAEKEIAPYKNHWVVEGIAGALSSIPQSALMWIPHVGGALFAKSVIQQTFEENMRGEKEFWREALHSSISAGGEVGAELALGAWIGSVKKITGIAAKQIAKEGAKLTGWQVAGLIGRAGFEEGLEGLFSGVISSTSYYVVMDNDKPPSVEEILKQGAQEAIGGLLLGAGNYSMRRAVQAGIDRAERKKARETIESIAANDAGNLTDPDYDDVEALFGGATLANDISNYTSRLRQDVLDNMLAAQAANPTESRAKEIEALQYKISNEMQFISQNNLPDVPQEVWDKTTGLADAVGVQIRNSGGLPAFRKFTAALAQPVMITSKTKDAEATTVPRSFVLRHAAAMGVDPAVKSITVNRTDGKQSVINLNATDRAFMALVQEAASGLAEPSAETLSAFGVVAAKAAEAPAEAPAETPAEAPATQPEEAPAEAPAEETKPEPAEREKEPEAAKEEKKEAVAEEAPAEPAKEEEKAPQAKAKSERKSKPKAEADKPTISDQTTQVSSKTPRNVAKTEKKAPGSVKSTPSDSKVKKPRITGGVKGVKTGATQGASNQAGIYSVPAPVPAEDATKYDGIAEATKQLRAAVQAGKSKEVTDALFDTLKREIAKACVEIIKDDGGASFFVDGRVATRGTAIAVHGLGISADTELSEQQIYDFINKNMDKLSAGYAIGPYFSKDTGKAYVDVAELIPEDVKGQALVDRIYDRIGKEESMYDIGEGQLVMMTPNEIYAYAGLREDKSREALYNSGVAVELYDMYADSGDIKAFMKAWNKNEKTSVDRYVKQVLAKNKKITLMQAWASYKVIAGYANTAMKMTGRAFLEKFLDVEHRKLGTKDIENATKQIKRATDRYAGARPRASIRFDEKRGKYVITLFEDGKISSLIHEVGHLFYETMTLDQRKAFDEYVGAKDGKWENIHRERFANGFRTYLEEGKAPTTKLKAIFEQFAQWLKGVFSSVQREFVVHLTPEARVLYGDLISKEVAEDIKLDSADIMAPVELYTKPDGTPAIRHTPFSRAALNRVKSWSNDGIKPQDHPALVSAKADSYAVGDIFMQDASENDNAGPLIVVGRVDNNTYIVAKGVANVSKAVKASKVSLDSAVDFVADVGAANAIRIYNSATTGKEIFTRENVVKERGEQFEAVPAQERFSERYRKALAKKTTENIQENYEAILIRRDKAKSPVMRAEFDIALQDIVKELNNRWDMSKRELNSKYVQLDPTWKGKLPGESDPEMLGRRVRNQQVVENILRIGVPRSLAEYLNSSVRDYSSPTGFSFLYSQLSNVEAFEKAQYVSKHEVDNAIKTGKFKNVIAEDPVTGAVMQETLPPAVLMAAVMLRFIEARQSGDTTEEKRILSSMAKSAREAGQLTQLFRALYKDSRKAIATDILRYVNSGVSQEQKEREAAAYSRFLSQMAAINRDLAAEFLKSRESVEDFDVDFSMEEKGDYDRVLKAIQAKEDAGQKLTAAEDLMVQVAFESDLRAKASDLSVEDELDKPEKKAKTPEEIDREIRRKIISALWPRFMEMFPKEPRFQTKPKTDKDMVAFMRDVLVNRKQYKKAWDGAKAGLLEEFKDDPPVTQLIEEFYTDRRRLVPIIDMKKMGKATQKLMTDYGLSELDLRKALAAKRKSGTAYALEQIKKDLNLGRNQMAALRPWLREALKEMQSKRYERMRKELKPKGKQIVTMGKGVEDISASIANEYKRRIIGQTTERNFMKDAGRMILAKLREVDPAEAKAVSRMTAVQLVEFVARNHQVYEDLFRGAKHELRAAYKNNPVMLKIMDAVFRYRDSMGKKRATSFDIVDVQKERAARRIMADMKMTPSQFRMALVNLHDQTTFGAYLASLNLNDRSQAALLDWLNAGTNIVMQKRGEQLKNQIRQSLNQDKRQKIGKSLLDRVTEMAATGILDDANVREYLAKKFGVEVLSSKQIDAINDFVAQLELLDKNSPEYHEEYLVLKMKLMNVINSGQSATWKERLLFFRAFAMLAGPRTVVKNLFNNVAMTPVMMASGVFESAVASAVLKIADPKGIKTKNIYRILNPKSALDKSIYGLYAQTWGSAMARAASGSASDLKQLFSGKMPKDKGAAALAAMKTVLAKEHPEIAKWMDQNENRIIVSMRAEAQNKMEVNIDITAAKQYVGNKTVDEAMKWWLDLYNRGDTPFALAWARFYLAQAMIANNTTELDPTLFNLAINRSLQNVWRADVALNHLARQLRHAEFLEKWAKEKEREGEMFLAGTARAFRNVLTVGITPTMLPFVTTIANLTTIAFHMSFGVFTGTAQMITAIKRADTTKSETDIAQTQRFNAGARNFGLGTVGMTAFFGMMALAAAGLATGAAPDDEKERAQWYAEGKQPFSIRIGDKWVSFDWLEPVATPMMLGAMFGNSVRRSRMGWEKNLNPLDAVWAMFNSYVGQTIFQGVFDVASDKPSETFVNMVSTLITGYVPASWRFVAQGIDGYRRNAYNPDAFLTMWYKVGQGVAPGTLPVQHDVWGRPVKIQGLTGDQWYNNLLLKIVEPFNSSADKTDRVSKEVMDVFSDMMTSDKVAHKAGDALPGIIQTSVQYKGRTITITNWERSKMQRDYGQKAYSMVSKLISTTQYKKFSPEKKAAALKAVYSAAREYAIEQWVSENDIDNPVVFQSRVK